MVPSSRRIKMHMAGSAIVFLASMVALSACSIFHEQEQTSMYERAVSQLLSRGANLGSQYSLTYQRTAGEPQPRYQELLDSADQCATELEKRRLNFAGSWEPTIAFATFQLLGCLSGGGWDLNYEEVIVVP